MEDCALISVHELVFESCTFISFSKIKVKKISSGYLAITAKIHTYLSFDPATFFLRIDSKVLCANMKRCAPKASH